MLIGVALMLSTHAFSQLSYGVKGGVNVASLTRIGNATTRTGYFAGGVAQCSFNRLIGIQAELLYSSQGVKYSGMALMDDMMLKTEGTVRFDYINIPLLAKLRLAEGLSLDAGPLVGFVVNARSKLDWVDFESQGFHRIDKRDYQSFDVSLAMGLSYRFSNDVEISARYNLGLTEVYRTGKNRVFQVGIGYRR